MENNSVVYDKLVNINGEQYYISKDGTKITNDGVVLKEALEYIDGKDLYFDSGSF